MASRIADMKITGVAKDIFLDKQAVIHDTMMEHFSRMARKNGNDGPPVDLIEGDENG
jgi:hypothetical protein